MIKKYQEGGVEPPQHSWTVLCRYPGVRLNTKSTRTDPFSWGDVPWIPLVLDDLYC